MVRFLSAIFPVISFLGILLIHSSLEAKMNPDSLNEQRLNEEITRYNIDTDKIMKCTYALSIFKKEFEHDPENAYAALYVGRAYDAVASIGGVCQIADDDFLAYSDSAIHYFHIADKLLPGIREKKYGFSVPVLLGHLFGSRCLWHLKNGDYDAARDELARGMREGGYSPAQIEVCRLMLDFCDSNSIFFPGGDDDTFPIMYLQMVEGYRTDVSVLNLSLLNLPWYLRLFLIKGKRGFSPIPITLSQEDIDSLEVVETKSSLPERLYTDVDPAAIARIHKELGIDVADKAEICFPVYLQYEQGYYTYGVFKALASILEANKWRRRIFFGMSALENILNCTHVAVRDGGIVTELYPINYGQFGHFAKGDKWYHTEKMNRIYLHDASMEKFISPQTTSDGQAMMYYGMSQYLLSMDSTDKSIGELIRRIQSIPQKSLEGAEKTIFACAQVMYRAGYKNEAKRVCEDLLNTFESDMSGSRTSIGQDEANYIIALVIAGKCSKAIEFVNSFEVSQEMKSQVLNEIERYYGCK